MRDWLSTSSHRIFDCAIAATTAAGSCTFTLRFKTCHVTARYIAPELTWENPSRCARARATLLLPEAAGPSMAMMRWDDIQGFLHWKLQGSKRWVSPTVLEYARLSSRTHARHLTYSGFEGIR